VLIGRDLSVGGMRVDRAPNLEAGQVLQLAIHVTAGETPLVERAEIRATTERFALRFAISPRLPSAISRSRLAAVSKWATAAACLEIIDPPRSLRLSGAQRPRLPDPVLPRACSRLSSTHTRFSTNR
jgi:hypothetical protein